MKTHGHTSAENGRSTLTYASWRSMKNRCLRPIGKHSCYEGVKIDPRWVNSFEAFLDDMGERPSRLHTIDRIDGNGGYNKDNCRWADKAEQAKNRSNNVYKGTSVEEKAIAEGLSPGTVRSRLRRGYSPEIALTKGVIKSGHDGSSVSGEKNANAKLTENLVREIRLSDESSLSLAKRLGVSKTTINMVRSGKIWRHVK